MKTLKFLSVFIAAALVAGVTGCSTPETRIQKNPEIFSRLEPAQQEMIKKGQVGVGFDQEMVKLAVGEADQVRSRTDANGTSEVWSYVTYEGLDGYPLYRGWYHQYYGWGDPLYPYYLTVSARHEREHLRVVFDATGKVTNIEQDKRGNW